MARKLSDVLELVNVAAREEEVKYLFVKEKKNGALRCLRQMPHPRSQTL